MNIRKMLSVIFFFLTIVVVLALAPTINTQNNLVIAANLTNCIGMAAVAPFGAPLIIISIMVAGGLLAFGFKGGIGVKDIIAVVGTVIVQVVGLTFFVTIITYVNTLITASTGFAITIYGIIPLIIYLALIAAAGGYSAVQTYRKRKGSKKSSYSGASSF